MSADLLDRKQRQFVLWRAAQTDLAPTLFIGNFRGSPADPYANFREIALGQSAQFPDIWEVDATACGLEDGQVYFYWFKVLDTNVGTLRRNILYCTDPIASTVDRRFSAPAPAVSDGIPSGEPASVILYRDGALVPCDPAGGTVDFSADGRLQDLPPNNRLVIYELPTRWARIRQQGAVEVGNGTFQDMLALLVPAQRAPNFRGVDALDTHAHLLELGANALELLPPADSEQVLEWGYGTSNFFAADFDLGHPDGQSAPTASVDLATVIETCHRQRIRFFDDMVMAFALNNPQTRINYSDFFVQPGQERGRIDFGRTLFAYDFPPENAPDGYDPISGQQMRNVIPARQYMKTYLTHWMEYYRIDGIRMDSVNNIQNYDFVGELKDLARSLWRSRGGNDAQFLVVGEELSEPSALLQQNRLDGLWNEYFKRILRCVIRGQNAHEIGEPSFEWSVRKLIDCRLLKDVGFLDGAQAVNYIGSHDVSGYRNERFYDYLQNVHIIEKEQRFKLAFVCLLTAVGIPMILAGDEFADQQDLNVNDPSDVTSSSKQIDPVNFDRLTDDWRRRIFDYVARLVRFRISSDALAMNDTDFIHVDFEEGKRVIVWQRGRGEAIVVIVANFSDYGSPGGLNGEYVVPNWPFPNRAWREITQERLVEQDQVGREPIFPWEAKVYTLA